MAPSDEAGGPRGVFGPIAAQAYERQMGRWSRRLSPPFLDFIGPIGGGTVLDVGCGTGSLRWLGKFGQSDEWIFCLTAAKVPRIRSDDDETSTADP